MASHLQVKDDFDNAKIEFELSSADAEISQDKDADQYEVQKEVIFVSCSLFILFFLRGRGGHVFLFYLKFSGFFIVKTVKMLAISVWVILV